MRRIDQLINVSRSNTDNVEFTDSTGISDEQFIEFANFGQDDLLEQIQLNHPDLLIKEKEIQAASGTETYSFPGDLFMGCRLQKVEYSPTGLSTDYYNLVKYTLQERFTGTSSDPVGYIRRGTSILLEPRPSSSGKIRLTYQYQIPRLDKRRAKVSAVTLGASTITSLTFDTTETIDDTELLDWGYMTIVDSDGVVKMRAIKIDSINTTSGAVTVNASFAFESGETIAVGDYAVAGKLSSTHSALPDNCERYLIQYMDYKAFKQDSAADSSEARDELIVIRDSIVQSFAQPESTIQGIPYISNEYDNIY